MNRYSADWILTPEGLQADMLLVLDREGRVMELRPGNRLESDRHFEGILCPGYVNAHCHLELSAMKGLIPEGTGMAGFASAIVSKRGEIGEEAKHAAIAEAIRQIENSGTVAIGDICNTADSIAAKSQSEAVRFLNFIEVLGLDPARAETIVGQGRQLQQAFGELGGSLTAHAPYSCSDELLSALLEYPDGPLSIHLLESKQEIELFQSGEGQMADFFRSLGIDFQGFDAPDPLQHITRHLDTEADILFVHCTQITADQLDALMIDFPQSHICLCPRSNQYIHGEMPDMETFLPWHDRVCLGTDSLASNHSLDIFEEARTLAKGHPLFAAEILLQMLTENGARALGMDDRLGSFRPGTTPGVNFVGPVGAGEIPNILPATQSLMIT